MSRRLAALLPVVLLLAACGTTELDLDKAEQLITDATTDQIGADVDTVECPDEVEPEAGATFECTVTATDGTKGEAIVTQKDDEGNVNVSAPFVRMGDLEERIAADIQRQVGGQVALECPQIVVGERGDTFECEATGDDQAATVLVTQRDDMGNVRYEIVE